MRNIKNIEFQTGSKEERLPDFAPDFPYISSHVELDKFAGHFVPWHWHKTVEIFYMESGVLEYNTPEKKLIFPKGSGGMINSNVLHMTKTAAPMENTTQLLHIFDTSLIAGASGSRIEQKYILPLITASQIDIIPLYPYNTAHEPILKLIHDAFYLPCSAFEYEINLRDALTQIWLLLFEQTKTMQGGKEELNISDDKVKQMMIYIHEHYAEKIIISVLAAAAFLSERECFRIFHNSLHMTPMEYITSYRLQMACHMLASGQESVTAIGHACGLGSSSYFGKIFREHMGCTPSQYRRKWQDTDI